MSYYLDKGDKHLFIEYSWGHSNGYLYNKELGYLHRWLMKPPKGMVVDHINGNILDNRRKNLRVCTRKENAQNVKVHKDNKLGIKGVSVHCDATRRKRYRGRIWLGKEITKYFETAQEASEWYQEKATECYGEFARFV